MIYQQQFCYLFIAHDPKSLKPFRVRILETREGSYQEKGL